MKKKILSIMLAMVMILSLGFTQSTEAKGKKVMKLSSKSITVVVGNTNKVSIKNAGKFSKKNIKAIKWSAGKNVKVKAVGKKKTTCVLTGIKKGKTTLKVKVKGKTLRCKVVVVKADASSTTKEEQDNEKTTDSSKKEDKKNTSSDKKNDNKSNTSNNKSNTKSDTSKTDKNDTKHVHKYSEWSEVEPTCTEDGYKTRKCSGCGEVEKVSTGKEKLGHDEERTTKVAATCTTGGTDLVTCKRCKTVLREEATKELGHNWSDWSVKDATCTEDGLKTRSCSRCNEVEKEIIKAKGHVYGEKEVVKPTCMSEGYTLETCERCSKTRQTNFTMALGHAKELKTLSAATFIEEGIFGNVCSRCKKTLDSHKYRVDAESLNPKYLDSLTVGKYGSRKLKIGLEYIAVNGGDSILFPVRLETTAPDSINTTTEYVDPTLQGSHISNSYNYNYKRSALVAEIDYSGVCRILALDMYIDGERSKVYIIPRTLLDGVYSKSINASFKHAYCGVYCVSISALNSVLSTTGVSNMYAKNTQATPVAGFKITGEPIKNSNSSSGVLKTICNAGSAGNLAGYESVYNKICNGNLAAWYYLSENPISYDEYIKNRR